MKNLPLYRYPTQAELYVLSQEAHRLRAEELARLMRVAANAIRSGISKFKVKELRHA